MFRIRRQKHEPRIELAPLIDVMLFLLTFFIYSVMVTERVELVPMELREYRSGSAAKPAPAATISVDLTGGLYLDRLPVAMDELVGKLEPMRTASPDLVVYLALADGESKVDRSAVLLDVWDRLQPAKFNVSIVGRRNNQTPATASPAGSPSGSPSGSPGESNAPAELSPTPTGPSAPPASAPATTPTTVPSA